MQQRVIAHCIEQRDRVAVLAVPLRDVHVRDVTEVVAWRRRFEAQHAALYHPWLEVIDPASPGAMRQVPPCGAVAGLYARNDLTTGVHGAPANLGVRWAHRPLVQLDEAQHGVLNGLGINVLRALSGRGLHLMGARTVSSDPLWRFVNVRRLMCMLGEALDHTTQWAVFEPNNAGTRALLIAAIAGFLEWMWMRGALTGATREQAFFVRCDHDNNPPDAMDNGRLFVDIGVAVVRPSEFVIVRLGRQRDTFAITELT
jgi:uncharacterized protein